VSADRPGVLNIVVALSQPAQILGLLGQILLVSSHGEGVDYFSAWGRKAAPAC